MGDRRGKKILCQISAPSGEGKEGLLWVRAVGPGDGYGTGISAWL